MIELTEQSNLKEMRKSIIQLAWPAVLRMLLESIVGTIDIIMVGSLGAASLAAVDVSNRIVLLVVGSLTALTIGSTALVARYVGANDQQKVDDVIWQSLLIGFLLPLTLVVIGFLFADDMLRLMMILMEEVDPVILEEGSTYIKIVFSSMIFGLPVMVVTAVLQGLGDMKTPLYIMLATNLANVIGNYILIFGVGVFPQLGVMGAALGTGFGRLVGAIVSFVVLIKGDTSIRLNWANIKWKLDWKVIKEIFSIGIPSAVEQSIRQSSQIIYTALIAGLGTLTIAANAIIINMLMIPVMFGFGFAVAATTLVGQSLGAKKHQLAKAYGKQSTYITMVLMSIISVPMFIWARPIIKLYTDNPEVVMIAEPVLRGVIFMQPLFAVVMVLKGALRGAGDTKWTMYITAIGNWGVRLILSLIFGYYLGYGFIGFWIGMAGEMVVRGILLVWRYESDRWQQVYELKEERELVADC
ncbi:MATE family efflux transporter [Natroniella sulfidigena]|uniref:MATE family efflux transporter n=1 Tax=Natroniella sulfidigena TaxID=723921 RepID=UPI00200B95EC|nr:MATE family efflux transporter [Natroniella sulfidigena]MCK8817227.1 MATE family efflux transporter [Natroniella sulfidigena]